MIVSITPDLALDEGYTYAGGLGVLEGDKFYGAARLGIPYKVLTFLYRGGYVDYDFDGSGNPIPKPQPQPPEFLERLAREGTMAVRLRGADVKVEVLSHGLGSTEAIFFRPIEPEWAAGLADRVYIWGGEEEKFYTYALLARASAEYLRRYAPEVDYIDLQEAYAAMLPLALKIPGRYRLVVHTAGPWGHPSFPRELFEREFGYSFIGREIFLTEIGLAASREAFAVSAKHFDIMSKVLPHFMDKLRYVTNGVCVERWMDPKLRGDYERGNLHLDHFIEARASIRKGFAEFIRRHKDVDIGDRMVLAWCRRLVPYKRPEFAIRAIEELPRDEAFFVLGGKAHPQDGNGLEYMRIFRRLHLERENVVYIPNYDIGAAKAVLKSADLLLFTPSPGWEACGTSYMKAAINGVPSLASQDGGALELIVDGVNGWLFGAQAKGPGSPPGGAAGDYDAFKGRLLEIASAYRGDVERYYKISLNALTSSIPRVGMDRVLREYYHDLIKR
jgi:starch phosphorylase